MVASELHSTARAMIQVVCSPSLFAVLAHELRSPATVIAGYMRMLREGRLDDAQQRQAFAQVEEAAHRIALVSQQASSMRRWVSLAEAPAGPTVPRSLKEVLSTAVADVAEASLDVSAEDGALTFPCLDAEAVSDAFRSLTDAASRDAGGTDVTVRVRSMDGSRTVVIGSTTDVAAFAADAEAGRDRAPFSLERGGHGLALALAALVLQAHRAVLWTTPHRPTLIGVTFPSEFQSQP